MEGVSKVQGSTKHNTQDTKDTPLRPVNHHEAPITWAIQIRTEKQQSDRGCLQCVGRALYFQFRVFRHVQLFESLSRLRSKKTKHGRCTVNSYLET